MNNPKKKTLIIFGFSQTLTFAIFDKSKIVKVKEFSILLSDEIDEFFSGVQKFIPKNEKFHSVLYSSGPGGFTLIRRILSYVKALCFTNQNKIIGINNLVVVAYHDIIKSKVKDEEIIISILNHSKDYYVQLFKKNLKLHFPLEKLTDIKTLDLNMIDTFLKRLDLDSKQINCAFIGPDFTLEKKYLLKFKKIIVIDQLSLIETIKKIFELIEKDKIKLSNYENFFDLNLKPIYGKLPSTS